MNLIAFILMMVFLSLGAAFYLFGILVVDHVYLSVQLDRKVQQYYHWVLSYGDSEQQEAAKISVKKHDLEHLQALVGIEAPIH